MFARLSFSLIVAACTAACAAHESQQDHLRADTLASLEETIVRDGIWRCNSAGGEVLAGVLLGSFLHARKIAVEIRAGDWCASAAAIATLGAPSLFKAAHGNLVFHGPSRSYTALERAFIATSLKTWSVPVEAREKLLGLSLGEVWVPDARDLRPLLTARPGAQLDR